MQVRESNSRQNSSDPLTRCRFCFSQFEFMFLESILEGLWYPTIEGAVMTFQMMFKTRLTDDIDMCRQHSAWRLILRICLSGHLGVQSKMYDVCRWCMREFSHAQIHSYWLPGQWAKSLCIFVLLTRADPVWFVYQFVFQIFSFPLNMFTVLSRTIDTWRWRLVKKCSPEADLSRTNQTTSFAAPWVNPPKHLKSVHLQHVHIQNSDVTQWSVVPVFCMICWHNRGGCAWLLRHAISRNWWYYPWWHVNSSKDCTNDKGSSSLQHVSRWDLSRLRNRILTVACQEFSSQGYRNMHTQMQKHVVFQFLFQLMSIKLFS